MKFSDLSFVGVDNTGEFEKVLPWDPLRTGDYEKDCAQGRHYFQELKNYIQATGNPTLFCRVLSAQVRGGTWDAVEIGFSQAMGELVALS